MKSDALFQLVRSMSAREKGYFKRFAGIHGNRGTTNYVLLFEAIEDQAKRQEVYDEEEVVRKLKNASFTRHLHVTKNYLQQLLLKSLVSYQAEAAENRLHFALMEIGILFQKGLYKEGFKLLRLTEKNAKAAEDWPKLLELAAWRYRFMGVQSLALGDQDEAEALFLDEMRWLQQQELLIRQQHLNLQLNLMFSREGFVRNEAQWTTYESFLENPNLRALPKGAGLAVRLQYYDTLTSAHVMMGDYHKGLAYVKRQMSVFESQTQSFQGRKDLYLVACNNLLLCLIQLGRFKQFFKRLEEFNHIPLDNREEQMLGFVTLRRNELRALVRKGDFDQAIKVAERVQLELQGFVGDLDKEMELNTYFYLFNAWFGAQRYRKALRWLNQILNHKGYVREDMRNFARLLEVVTHFELGNYLLLESLVNALKQYSRKQSPTSFGSLILDFFQQLQREEQRGSSLKKAAKSLVKALRGLPEGHPERRYLEYFDFEAWAKSLYGKRSFVEEVQRRK